MLNIQGFSGGDNEDQTGKGFIHTHYFACKSSDSHNVENYQVFQAARFPPDRDHDCWTIPPVIHSGEDSILRAGWSMWKPAKEGAVMYRKRRELLGRDIFGLQGKE